MSKQTTSLIENYETILVAFVVKGRTTEERQYELMRYLPFPDDETNSVDSWWIAEDDRYDNSDNDSAIFVRKGTQAYNTRKLSESR